MVIDKLNNNNLPNFLFLSYTASYLVSDLILIPKFFFILSIIEKRAPLKRTAKRSGWFGCNILYKNLPEVGRINIIQNSKIQTPNSVRNNWLRVKSIQEMPNERKGWLFDVLSLMELLNKPTFRLHELYQYESELSKKYPQNQNIRPKIRQQLQILRGKKIIKFLGSGKYELL